MKSWLADNGMEMDSLAKEVAAAIKTAPQDITDVLSLRQQQAKSSVKKYTQWKMLFVRITVQGVCFSFMEPTEPEDCGSADSVTEPLKTIWKIWQRLGPCA